MRPAEQRVAFLELVVGQRERRVPVVLDILALEDERLAGGALPLLAAMHEHDSLLGRGPQDRLVLAHLDLDADRLEADDVLFAHGPLGDCVGLTGTKRHRSVGGGGPETANRVAPSAAWLSRPPGPDGRPGPAGCSRRGTRRAARRSSR